MPSSLNAYLLSAVMLCALLLCAPGAPAEDAPTDSPAGDPSGEEEEEEMPSDLLSASPVWASILGATERHKEEFEEEFKEDDFKYIILEPYNNNTLLPARCSHYNFSKEACLHRMFHGLLIYTVLLKYVEKEYPGNSICKEFRYYGGLLINLIKGKMRHRGQVTALTSSQEAQLLRDLDLDPYEFRRKMIAHSILRQLHYFLLEGKTVITKKEIRQRQANRTLKPIAFNQMLKR